MCFENRKCNAWMDLDPLGIPQQGCLKNAAWLSSIQVMDPSSTTNRSTYIDTDGKKLVSLGTVSSGTFGQIDIGIYTTPTKSESVYIKCPIFPGQSLLHEACIQKLVSDSLQSIGFPTGAPKPVCIFKLHDGSVCFAMQQIQEAVTLDHYIASISSNQLASTIIDCLLQLCAMVWHLQSTLGINHRDLKPSNFLIVEHDIPIRKILLIQNERLEIDSKRSLTFIDFGFSCLGSTETHVSNISLSTVYSSSDPCPKEGRDMYLFLAFLYVDYHSKLPPRLLSLFEQWLNIPGTNLCEFMKRYKERSKPWIYFITGNESITSFSSCPYIIMNDLKTFVTRS